MPVTAQHDLADQVNNHMTANHADTSLCGFTVYRGEDGTAAVGYRAGFVDAYSYVLRQTLLPWADGLRDAGFVVDAVYGGTGGIPHDYPSWLKVTAYHPSENQPKAKP